MCEVPLPNGRRADMMAIDAKGQLIIVEIKVSKADLARRRQMDRLSRLLRPLLLGGARRPCAGMLDGDHFLPGEAGLLVADRYDAAIWREAALRPLAPARRKAETVALRPPRRAPAVGADRSDARLRQLELQFRGARTA